MLERLPAGDPEPVLRAMEAGLREISSELSREGHRITISGLGPSPRVKNRRDCAVIDVTVEDGATIIQVDATFQASAFLGEISQNAVVEAKLRRVFEETRAQLGLAAVAPSHVEPPFTMPPTRFSTGADGTPEMSVALDPAAPLVEMQPAAIPSDPVPEPNTRDVIEPAEGTSPASIETLLPPPPEIAVEAAAPSGIVEEAPEPGHPQPAESIQPVPVPAEEPGKATTVDPVPVPAPIPLENSKEIAKTETAKTKEAEPPAPAAVSAPTIGKKDGVKEVQQVLSDALAPEGRKRAEPGSSLAASPPDAKKSSSGVRWAIAAIAALVLALTAWFYLPHELTPSSSAAPVKFASSTDTPVPVQSLPESPKPAPEQPGSQDDPQAVIKDWEAALRSTDATQQASFYADPVDRYFLRRSVKREDVLADKQANIAKRQGDWSIALERVQVRQKPEEVTATVRLVKHYTIHQGGHLTSQWYVPSQMLLKRTDGHWQITSERDLGWSDTMDDLDY